MYDSALVQHSRIYSYPDSLLQQSQFCWSRRIYSLWFLPIILSLATSAAKAATVTQVSPAEAKPSLEGLTQTLRRSTPILPPAPAPTPPLPEQPLPPLPAPDELLSPPAVPPQPEAPNVPISVYVKQFNIVGSTVFSAAELAAAVAPFVGRQLSFTELLQARSAVTQLYVSRGYISSGAFIPPQRIQNDTVTIQIIEGYLEEINITGTRRLQSSYIRSRIRLAASAPLNVNRLVEGLQLLQLDPLIETISADLQAGTRPGSSVLQVRVAEANPFKLDLGIDNNRSPSVGSFRRSVQFNQANVTGLGDGFSLYYGNTSGSNEVNLNYTIPINPRNGTVELAAGFAISNVVEPPFNAVDIEGNSRYYQVTLRQPLIQSPTEEFALGLTAGRQESQVVLSSKGAAPVAISPGADANGWTRSTVVRFFQDWTERDSQHVIAARSQFSLGLDLLNATVNDVPPDSRFFAWRGQAQWVRLFAPDLLLLVRGDLQLTGDALIPVEQFSVGGSDTVRGYRQDYLLTDNGAVISAESRLPILRVPQVAGLLQVAPFIDLGTGWNNARSNPDPNFIVGIGLGLLWTMGSNFSARLDYGFPLVTVEGDKRTWQENGIYFKVNYSFF